MGCKETVRERRPAFLIIITIKPARRVYPHADLAYHSSFQVLPPLSLSLSLSDAVLSRFDPSWKNYSRDILHRQLK